MSNYRRGPIAGGSYFFTVVTHQRQAWLCTDAARTALREAIAKVRTKRPFVVEAWVSLPDHLHCIWRLPPGDADFATRWRLIKSGMTKRLVQDAGALRFANAPYGGGGELSASRKARGEQGLWQRRFWEHTLRNDADYRAHCDYIHYNPVKHGLCRSAKDWPYSTFHRFVAQGKYDSDWATLAEPQLSHGAGE